MTAPNLAPPTMVSKDWARCCFGCGHPIGAEHSDTCVMSSDLVTPLDCTAQNFAAARANHAETESLTRPSEPLPAAVGRMVVDEPAPIIGSIYADEMRFLIVAALFVLSLILCFVIANVIAR